MGQRIACLSGHAISRGSHWAMDPADARRRSSPSHPVLDRLGRKPSTEIPSPPTRSIRSRSLPEGADGHGMELVSERERDLAVVENDTVDETVARGLTKSPQSAKVTARHG